MPEYLPTDYDIYLFHKGCHYQSYDFLGAHPCQDAGKAGIRFTVWAPNAEKVSVIGDFNNWQDSLHTMSRIKDSGLWTLFIPGVDTGSLYKYKINGYKGQIRYKADPYAISSEESPGTASRVYSGDYEWSDQMWEDRKKNLNLHQEPMMITKFTPVPGRGTKMGSP